MTKSLSFATSVLVAAALAVPVAAAAQASPRGGGSSSGQASPRGGGETSAPRSVATPSSPAPSATSSSSSSGGGDNTARARGSAGNGSTRGTAQARPGGPLQPGSRGGGWYYPPYYPSFGYGYGYGPYSFYGSSLYWSRYGYDPFLFDPFGYYGYYGYYDGFGRFGGAPYYETDMSYSEGPREIRGSVRLKVDPKQAKVYVDGALAGTADDFDGLSDHLTIAAGPHQLELRADGYESYSGQIDIVAGQTRTTRVTLKKK